MLPAPALFSPPVGGKALSADSKINEWPIESHKSTTIVNALFPIYFPWIEDP